MILIADYLNIVLQNKLLLWTVYRAVLLSVLAVAANMNTIITSFRYTQQKKTIWHYHDHCFQSATHLKHVNRLNRYTLLILYEVRILSQHCCPLTALEHKISMEARTSSTGPSVSSCGAKLSTLIARNLKPMWHTVLLKYLLPSIPSQRQTYSCRVLVETPLKSCFFVFLIS